MIKITSTKTHGLSVQGLTPKQLLVMGYILKSVNDKCYSEKNDGDTGDYVRMLPEEEREVLRKLAEGVSQAVDNFVNQ